MKVAVVEDSGLAREGLVSMLGAYPDLELICSADHTDTALEVLKARPADVLFLDIHMPGSSGFELLASLSYSPLIIFTTAYSEYSIRSFDFNTVDYLLKPISQQRLDQAIAKLRRQFALSTTSPQLDIESSHKEELQPALEPGSRLFIKDNDKCYLIELASIRYFESCKNEARAFFDGNKAFIKRTMNELELRLPATLFFRANRQYIVNLQAVKSIEESASDGFSLMMIDGMKIDISRRRATQMAEMLRL
ncbi:MAG: LytTR family DNA-binding domain-containing protein [Steroidobacteraceae bacterium]